MGQRQQKKRKKQKKHRRHSSERQSANQSSRSDKDRRSRKKKSHHNRDESPVRKQKHRKRKESFSSRQQKRKQKPVKNQPQAILSKDIKVEAQPVEYDGWKSSPQPEPNIKQEPVKLQEPAPINPEAPVKQQPNFEPSGILLKYYNAREGIALKFHQPPQSHNPLEEWRVYPFKQNSPLLPIILKKSCYLIGKDERICDILCQNSSISRQHAVIQFRSQYKMQIDGTYLMEVKPYIMDLDSTNGTMLNGQVIESSRYYQLLEKDVLKFGLSEREYVMFRVPDSKAQVMEE